MSRLLGQFSGRWRSLLPGLAVLLLLVPTFSGSATPTPPLASFATASAGTPQAGTVPTSPSILSGVPHSSSIDLAWSAPISQGSSFVSSYTVAWSLANGTGGSRRLGNVTNTTVGKLAFNTSYTFTVAAWNAVGESPLSIPWVISTGFVPAAPSNLSVLPGNNSLTVQWAAPAIASVYPVTGYLLNLTPKNGVPILVPNASSPWLFTGLTDGQVYIVTVRAQNEVGWSPTAPRIEATPVGPPFAPRNFAAVYNGTTGNLELSWIPPTQDGGTALEGYTLTWWTPSGVVGDAYLDASKLNYSLKAVAHGVEYEIALAAVNPFGESPGAHVAVQVPSLSAPASPASVWTNGYVVIAFFTGILMGTFVLLFLRPRKPAEDEASETYPEVAHDRDAADPPSAPG